MTDETDPNVCRSCGAPITMVKGKDPRGREAEARRCTNPTCNTNNPRRRKMGEKP